MCGIVGYSGKRPVLDILLKGLARLEYRGYDSAGVAYFNQGKLEIEKSEGRLSNVEKIISNQKLDFASITCGIGHTRWATHGKPTTQNAHPHRTGHVVLVHNGIIENFQHIRNEMLLKGHKPKSETDSELFGFLVLDEMEKGTSLVEAVRRGFKKIEGSCSVVVISEKEPGTVVGVRNGSPLVAALDPQGGAFLASDAQPIIEYTKDVTFLENGDICVATDKGLEFLDLESGKKIDRKSTFLDWNADQLDKQGYPHYMLKEIHEQPAALVDTLNSTLDRARADAFSLADQPSVQILDRAKRITFIACGTSYYASMVGKLWIERWAGIPVNVELASEYKYREQLLLDGEIIVGVSQSGETADTLVVLRDIKKKGIPTLAITNVRGSTMSREVDGVFFTSAGPEIGVAATKSFSTQLMVFLLWAGYLAQKNKTDFNQKLKTQLLFQSIVHLPHLIKDCLELDSPMMIAVKRVAKSIVNSSGLFFIGRGFSYPLALEGSLKVKEISYIHAEGYAAGELKHGPIAMIDNTMSVVVLAPTDAWRDKTVSNLQEVKARGAKIIGVGGAHDLALKEQCDEYIPLPISFVKSGESSGLDESLVPFILGPVVQLLSYELAVLKGTDVDKPRNLAKSVTVE